MYTLKIKMLDVGDADATIISMTRKDQSLVILIDGGRPGDAQTILEHLNPLLEKVGKKAPDLVVCTHYDNDHIGGLNTIIDHYGKSIGEVWIHRTTSLLDLPGKVLEWKRKKTVSSVFPSEDDLYLAGEGKQYLGSEETQELIRTIEQEKKLLALIDSLEIPQKEPIAGQCQLDNWPELKVIGPSMDYYKQLFPDHFDSTEIIREEQLVLKEDLQTNAVETGNPCQDLDTAKRARVTRPNLNSAILLIEINDKKILFAADAGIPSFLKIPDFEKVINGIHWLKMPHHGSANNINSTLISLMNPRNVFISGNKHISPLVTACLEQNGITVLTTRDTGNLEFNL